MTVTPVTELVPAAEHEVRGEIQQRCSSIVAGVIRDGDLARLSCPDDLVAPFERIGVARAHPSRCPRRAKWHTSPAIVTIATRPRRIASSDRADH
jgi:hypothetical protein